MKKLAILGSAIAFFLLSNVATHAKTMSQSTQNQKTDTELLSKESTNKPQSEQEQKTDTEQETESTDKPQSEQKQNSTNTEQDTESTDKPQSTSNGGY